MPRLKMLFCFNLTEVDIYRFFGGLHENHVIVKFKRHQILSALKVPLDHFAKCPVFLVIKA